MATDNDRLMKNIFSPVRLALFILATIGWGLWIHDKLERQPTGEKNSTVRGQFSNGPLALGGPPATGNSYPGMNLKSSNPARLPDPLLSVAQATRQQQYQIFSQALRKVMQDSPYLAQKQKEIVAELDAQRERLNAAMIKIDPKVAPIVAKLEAMHQRALAMAASANRVNEAPRASAGLSK